MKRLLSVLLAVLMLMSVMPLSAFAGEIPTFEVGSLEVAPGDIIDVPVSIYNNPGIISFVWEINYEEDALELLKVTPLQYTSMVVGPPDENPLTINWCEGARKEDCADNGEVLLLTFRVKEDAAPDTYPLSLYYDPANVFNVAFESVRFNVESGWITVQSAGCNHEYDSDCDAACNICGESRATNGHVYYVTETAPTCEAAGSTTYTCEICGHKYTTKIPATGHKYETTYVEARCDAEGYDLHTCVICGDSYKDNFTPMRTEHGIVPGEEFFSCTESGYANYYCMYCDYSYQETWDAPGHSPVDYPTMYDCQRYTYCQRCNEMLKPATGHIYNDLWDQVDPTCEADGYARYGCYGCSAYEIVAIPATGKHVYDNDYDATCNECGASRDVAPCPHKYTVKVLVAATCTTGGLKRYTCAMCGDSYEEITPAIGHAYDNDFDADCNNCGEKRQVQTDCQHAYKNPEAPVCAVCGETLSLSDMLTVYGVADNAQLTRGDVFTLTVMMKNNPGLVGWRVYLGFDESVLELVKQTGDAMWGNTTFGPLKSPVNVMFSDAIHPDVEGDGTMFTLTFRVREDAAFGTSLLDVYVMDPMDFYDQAWSEFVIDTVDTAVVVSDHVHTYDGVCDGACNICGYTRDAEEHTYDHVCDAVCNGCGLVREVKPHPYEAVVTDPTCTADGCTTYTCTICGDTYADSIPALGHDYTVTVFAPDCVNDGYTLHACNRCRYSYTDAVVPALGHKAGAEADCLNPQICTVCNVELNPALGHDYEAVVTAPTCTTEGYTTHTCARCGDSFVDSTVAALGHAYEGVVTAPTCTTEGYTTYTCATCGHTYVDDMVAALGHSYDNACDATCNACDYVREVGDHVYDHDYDATCNECGAVREIPVLPGDVNDDGNVNVRDYGLLQQYLNGWDVTIIEVAANVNGDSNVNVRDLGLLQQYLNGWDVTLGK